MRDNSTDNRYHLGVCQLHHAKSFVRESHRRLSHDMFLLCSVHNVGVYWPDTQRKGKGTTNCAFDTPNCNNFVIEKRKMIKANKNQLVLDYICNHVIFVVR